MANTVDLRHFSPDSGDAKDVENTPMLNTMAKESVDMEEQNTPGEELVNNNKVTGPFGAIGRN